MEWIQRYPKDKQPTLAQVEAHIANPLWQEFRGRIEQLYGSSPGMEYSRCSGQPGWNVKYKKGSTALCTLYPMEGFFIALVVVGPKQMQAAELLITSCAAYTQSLFERTAVLNGQKWLMIQATTKDILEDTLRLIALRAKPALPKGVSKYVGTR